MLVLSVKIFYGEAATIVKENTSLLQGTPLTLRLGFPDVVFPGDVRNELYIKLWSGDFAGSHTGGGLLSVAGFRGQIGPISHNVQVSIEVRDQDGRLIEGVISQGSGEGLMTQFHSMVFQRSTQPTFNELIKLQLPLQGVPQWHLFITFRNRSGKDKSSGRAGADVIERPFAFAFFLSSQMLMRLSKMGVIPWSCIAPTS
jgi:dedicator of cytokinesis protein 3